MIDRGVVRRSTRVVPLDRIRSVDITATAIHRALGVVQVEVEAAAGGRESEALTLVAVTPETAAALRDRLLAGRPDGEVEEMPPPSVLYRATPSALAVAGATSWRYVLAPLAVIGVLWNLAENVPGGVLVALGDAVLDRVPSDAIWVALLAVGAFAAAVALGALGSLLVDWAFVLTDDGERLVATRGLLTRRAVTIDRARVRGVDVRDSPLRRPLRLVSVAAVAGGIAGGAGGRATLAPILDAEAATRLVRLLDPASPALHVALTPHPRAARGRRLVRAVGPPAVAAALAAAVGAGWRAVVALVVLAAAGVPLAFDRYRQLGHRFDDERVVVREGSLSRRWSAFDPAAVVRVRRTSVAGTGASGPVHARSPPRSGGRLAPSARLRRGPGAGAARRPRRAAPRPARRPARQCRYGRSASRAIRKPRFTSSSVRSNARSSCSTETTPS